MSITMLKRSYEASASIDAYRVAAFSDAANGNKIAPATSATQPLAGTTGRLGGAAGTMVDIDRVGVGQVQLGAAVSAGDPLTANAAAKAIKATTAGQVVFGWAEQPGVADDIIDYLAHRSAIAGASTTTVSISAAQARVEGNSGATLYTYTVTRSSAVGAANVGWTFAAGGTSADDFTGGAYPAGGTVAMADGAATGTFTISVNGDATVEGDESFTVSITPPGGYTAGSAVSATGTILNDDSAAGGPAYAYNYSASYVASTKARLAATAAGTGYTKIACWADSLGAGAGAGTGANAMDGASVKSWPAKLVANLPAGANPIYEAVLGDHTNPAAGSQAVADYYGNVVFAVPADWTRASSSLGGNMFVNASAAGSSTLTITPRSPVDTFEIYYQRLGTGGSFTVSDGSGVLATINTSGAQAGGYLKQVVTRAVASNSPIIIQRTVAGDIYFSGVEMYRSTVRQTRVINLGAYGTTSTAQANVSNAFSPSNAIKTLAPDCTIIAVGTNDITVTPVATYKTQVQTMITAAKVSGDVILVHAAPALSRTPAQRDPYRAALLELAVTNNCILMDWTELMVALGGALAAGGAGPNSATYYSDDVHLLEAGYTAEASTLQPLFA